MKRKVFVTREQIISGEYYGLQQKSYTSMIASAIYSRTIGMFWGSGANNTSGGGGEE